MAYIYKIENKINHKLYIGQTVKSLAQRKADHYYLLRHNKHHSYKLQKEWNFYGEENFFIEILEECPVELLNEKEEHYIQFYNSFEEGYNCNLGGHFRVDVSGKNNPMYGKKGVLSPRFIDFILQVKPETLEVVACFTDLRSAAKAVGGVSPTDISKCCRHLKKTYHGFLWFYQKDFLTIRTSSLTPDEDSR